MHLAHVGLYFIGGLEAYLRNAVRQKSSSKHEVNVNYRDFSPVTPLSEVKKKKKKKKKKKRKPKSIRFVVQHLLKHGAFD